MATPVLNQDASNTCANTGTENNTGCEKPGSLACSRCRLVLYCSSACQKAHWSVHKKDCKSTLLKDTWKPDWVMKHRVPSFVDMSNVSPSWSQSAFGVIKYLWGNVPAVDFVKLEENEGASFHGPLNLLFAASGDLRNVIMSIAHLPPTYKEPVNVVMNDLDINIVARNAVLLFIFLVVDNPRDAARHAIHIFYSALVTKACHEVLQTKIEPLIQDVCKKIANKPPTGLLGKTWSFSGRTLRIVLSKADWNELLSFFDVPTGMTKNTAQKVRTRVVAAPERVDYVDRHLGCQIPEYRLSKVKFRSDGLLLPFGASRAAFDVPNPTIFQNVDQWPILDNADPLDGWSLNDIVEFPSGPATNDIYGNLYNYLLKLFVQFHQQLTCRPLSIQLNREDARDISGYVAGMKFSRIEASNIADTGYVGIQKTFDTLAPLLQSPAENPHATIVLLFLNAVPEMISMLQMESNSQMISQNMQVIAKYMPIKPSSLDTTSMEMMKIMSAMDIVRDFDMCFNMYTSVQNFSEIEAQSGLERKAKHTIINEWPLRFNFGPPTVKAKRDFALLLSSGHTGHERYAEWKVSG